MTARPHLLHATAVVVDGRCVLLTGASGVGKSDLALRLIDRGASLLADDYVELADEKGSLVALAPKATAGLIEIRGIGLVSHEHLSRAVVALVVDLDMPPERLPEAGTQTLCGHQVPKVALAALEASAPIKVEAALRRFGLRVEERPR